MKFSHSEEKRDDRELDVLVDEENGLRIVVSRLGAELISLARVNEAGKWTGFLYRDNDLSVPSQGGQTTRRSWAIIFIGSKMVVAFIGATKSKAGIMGSFAPRRGALRDSPGREAVPRKISDYSGGFFPSRISVEGQSGFNLQIELNKLSVLFEFQNHEPELTAHVTFGLHPGFAATSFETFHLQMPRGHYRRHFSPGNFFSGQTREIEFPGGEMPFPKTELSGSIILELVDVPRPQFSYIDPPSGRWVTLDLTGVPYMTLWSDGGPFLCIEPCWGLTDHHEQRAFEDKQGIQTISPRANCASPSV